MFKLVLSSYMLFLSYWGTYLKSLHHVVQSAVLRHSQEVLHILTLGALKCSF